MSCVLQLYQFAARIWSTYMQFFSPQLLEQPELWPMYSLSRAIAAGWPVQPTEGRATKFRNTVKWPFLGVNDELCAVYFVYQFAVRVWSTYLQIFSPQPLE